MSLKEYSERVSGDTHQKTHIFRGTRGRGRGGSAPRDNRHEAEKPSFLQNPVNIKVELVASTGERNCKLDEETKLADIKHVPNYKMKDMRPTRNENCGERGYTDKHRNERGRGRGQRGMRGRGRGGRGRGRGRGEGIYSSNRNNENWKNKQSPKLVTPEVVTDENWDAEFVDTRNQSITEHEEEESETGHEEGYVEGEDGHEYEDQEQYYEDDEQEYLDTSEHNYSQTEESSDSNIQLEENLVITSSASEEKSKRTVKFTIDGEQDDGAAIGKLENGEKRPVEKKSSKKEGVKNPERNGTIE